MSTLTGAVASPVGAIVQYLLGISDITDLVDQRVVGGAIPSEGTSWERMITVRRSGGLPDLYQQVIDRPRFEFRCYALTDEEAEEIYLAMWKHISGKTGIQSNDCLIKSIWMSSGGANLYDENINRPFMLSYADSIVQTEKITT